MLRPLWNGVRRLRFSRRLHAPVGSVVDRTEFESALTRERARTDRGGRAFAVLGVHPRRLDDATEHAILRILDERLRPYDLASILHPGEIVALLPETPRSGAETLGQEVLERLDALEIEAEVTVYTYPSDTAGPEPGQGSAPGEGADPDGQVRAVSVGALEPHLVQPIGFLRRGLDLVVSGTGLVVLSPVLLLTAAAVKLTSPGPIIYKQLRAGAGGRPFTFLKFRSMFVDADQRLAELRERNEKDGPIFKMRNDPRMTPIGRFLRKTSIDELPQLWNVFRGDMTLIGPRPPKVEEVVDYEPWQRRRLFARGGLTCIWQVSGRSEIGFVDWVRMDLRYLDTRSLRLDLRLLLKTIGAVFSGRGAY